MATVTVDVQRDATGLKGISNNNMINGWSGTDKHLPIGKWDNEYVAPTQVYLTRSLVKFQIPFASTWTGITSATLKLTQRERNPASNKHAIPDAGTSLQLLVRRMLRDWWEGTNNGEYLWTGQDQLGFDRRCAHVAPSGENNWTEGDGVTHNFTQDNDNVENIDITAIVTKWFEDYKGIRDNAPNYGVILINGDEDTKTKAFDFMSSEAGTGVPQLVVVYTTATDPEPPDTGEDSPNGSITSPTDGGTVTKVIPTVTWTYSDPNSKAQESARIRVFDVLSSELIHEARQYGTSLSYDIPAGANLADSKEYDVELKVRNVDLIGDPTPDLHRFTVDVAAGTNPPVTRLTAAANEAVGAIYLTWTAATINVGTFKHYAIYRKRDIDGEWELLDIVDNIATPLYTDWSAGMGIRYDYRVTVVARVEEE